MFLGFLGSPPSKDPGHDPRAVRKRWTISLRVAISVVVAGTALVYALGDLTSGSGRLVGTGTLGLVEDLIGPLPGLPQSLRVLLEATPAALVVLLIGAVIAWRVFPRLTEVTAKLAPRGVDSLKAQINQISGARLAIVSRQCPQVFAQLEDAFRGNPEVRVILDRRWGDNRYHDEPRDNERRQRDRRRDSIGLGPTDVIVVPRMPESKGERSQSGEAR